MKIVELYKSDYKGYALDCNYQTKAYYDVIIKSKKDIKISIKRKKYGLKKEKGFVSHLFEDYIEQPKVFGMFDQKKLVGVIEGSVETWNNRFRIWNFFVEKKYRNEGIGKALFEHMVEFAKSEKVRAIILEVQSCNDNAIRFYMKSGLHFVGLNTMEYSNDDIERKEVRLEMGKRLV
jgi:ribosomal protein S18 acetylase RimI-like enzyme